MVAMDMPRTSDVIVNTNIALGLAKKSRSNKRIISNHKTSNKL